MTRSLRIPDIPLSDLEAPQLDLAAGMEPEAFLDRLRTQNSALDRLRRELLLEERLLSRDRRSTQCCERV